MGALSAGLLVASAVSLVLRVIETPNVAIHLGWLFIAVLVTIQFVLSLLDRPFTVSDTERAGLEGLRVVILVPCYNEDPELLVNGLRSMLGQTRTPAAISVVDDGSSIDYADVERTMRAEADAAGVQLHWRRTQNHGKRYALVNAARREPDADIYMTVDSDSILDRAAIEEGLKPFADARVQSVAGFLLVLNAQETWLTRMMELLIVSWGLFERSALSLAGSVLVNSGACAFYRAEVVRESAADFLSETILGRRMTFSDDSLLTLFALERGRAVHQRTCFVFSSMPTAIRPHLIQQSRWMRGAIVRAWWRFKYLPLTSVAYWALAAKWLQFLLQTVVPLIFLAVLVSVAPQSLVVFGVWWLCVQFAISSRYLALRRSDQTRRQRWVVFACVPVMVFWQAFVLHPLRLYAYATFARTGWGSRASVSETIGEGRGISIEAADPGPAGGEGVSNGSRDAARPANRFVVAAGLAVIFAAMAALARGRWIRAGGRDHSSERERVRLRYSARGN
ncbi:glycosyltransferase [Rathayibacter sp. YIM 133350]|uniref:glycosyltransferase n=1 Tax=Rathayibacter sp. YIM 133350 TaxID=3131992 RepID=UPI00307CEE4D